jgi:protein TonB
VIFEYQSRRLIVAGVILLAHVAAILVLTSLGPRSESTATQLPIAVHFISQPIARSRWQPPQVQAVAPDIVAKMPDPPLVEIPVSTALDHAINIPVRTPVAVQAQSVDRRAPKMIASVEYLREPAPRYPPQSRKLREQGLVVLRVLIDERGTACSIEVESSSGYARLDLAAREAVSRAAFRPYVEDGMPRRALVLIPIEFSLNRSTA